MDKYLALLQFSITLPTSQFANKQHRVVVVAAVVVVAVVVVQQMTGGQKKCCSRGNYGPINNTCTIALIVRQFINFILTGK